MRRAVRQFVTDSRAAVGGGNVVPPALRRPGVVLLGLGVVALVSSVVPVLGEHCQCLLEGEQMTFAVGSAAVVFSRTLALLVVAMLALPFLVCLAVTVLTGLIAAGAGPLATLAGRGLSRSRPADLSRPSVSVRDTVGFVRRQGRSLVRTYPLVAVGFLPQFVATLVSGAVLSVAALSGSEFANGAIALTPAGHVVVSVPGVPAVTALTHGVGAVCTLASGVLWVRAVGRGREISVRLATVGVAPVVLLLVYLSDLAGHVPF